MVYARANEFFLYLSILLSFLDNLLDKRFHNKPQAWCLVFHLLNLTNFPEAVRNLPYDQQNQPRNPQFISRNFICIKHFKVYSSRINLPKVPSSSDSFLSPLPSDRLVRWQVRGVLCICHQRNRSIKPWNILCLYVFPLVRYIFGWVYRWAICVSDGMWPSWGGLAMSIGCSLCWVALPCDGSTLLLNIFWGGRMLFVFCAELVSMLQVRNKFW